MEYVQFVEIAVAFDSFVREKTKTRRDSARARKESDADHSPCHKDVTFSDPRGEESLSNSDYDVDVDCPLLRRSLLLIFTSSLPLRYTSYQYPHR